MQLHEQHLSKGVARKLAPWISKLILGFKLTDFVRKLIALLNYCIGRGSGMGWALDEEVGIAVSCIRRDSPIVFDVGGNVGNWSQLFRQSIVEGDLYIFEPQPSCRELIKAKNIVNSKIINAAVGKEKSSLTMYSSSPTDESASLHKRGESYFEGNQYAEIVVDVVALDDFITEHDIDFVDYIKFDIEGHELAALAGVNQFLSARKIGAFSFEFGSGNLNSRTCFRDFWDRLKLDYSIFVITPSGKLDEITEYYEDMEYYRGVSNFVAILKPSE